MIAAITPVHPILAKQKFINENKKKRVGNVFPLKLLKILCIVRSERGCLEATFPDTLEQKNFQGTFCNIKEWVKLAS